MDVLGIYRNGNYTVTLYDDGTRVRETVEDVFKPVFPECMDVQISSLCYNGCKWCYAGCSPRGRTADLKAYKSLFDKLHPYTEFAINLNFPLPDDFNWFLEYMNKKHVIVNATVAQNDFMEHYDLIYTLTSKGLIHGVGISLITPDDKFIKKIIGFPNLIIHVINGVVSPSDLFALSYTGNKLLILGYKLTGRGMAYHKAKNKKIKANQRWLKENIVKIVASFDAIGFDNLALKQLDFKKYFSDNEWNKIYSGDEGEFTLYLDLVNGTFAMNSMSLPIGEIMSKSPEDMLSLTRLLKTGSQTVKRQIREAMFETNSSSMHSIVITKHNHIFSKDELTDKSYRDISKWDQLPLTTSNKLELTEKDLTFGYGDPPYFLFTIKEKAAFVIASYNGNGYAFNEDEVLEELAGIIKEVAPEFAGFIFEQYGRDEDDEKVYYKYGGIDHQSQGLLQNFLTGEHISLRDFILNGRYYVVIDSDSNDFYHRFTKFGIIDSDTIIKRYTGHGEDENDIHMYKNGREEVPEWWI